MRTEFYGLGFYPAESCTVAFPWVFTINSKARFGNDEGPSEIQLGVSRDLRHWERPFRTPVIPRGKPGDWDSGFFFTQSRALRVEDEVWLYYSAGNFTHGAPCLYRAEGTGRGTKYTSSIGLVRWKLDRFVSADGPDEGATLLTVPIVFSGDRIEINARTGPSGSITVEVLDAARRPIESYGMSRPVRGDSVRHRVEWSEDRSIGQLRGRSVCLRFHLRRAQLFSFAFRTGA
jgi:hypothetical protein